MSKIWARNRERAFGRVLLLVILAALSFRYNAHAEALYQFQTKELTITLYDDRCDLKDAITNLPRKVVWTLNGVETEGCWGFSEQFSLILLYFADKTATALPAPLFGKLNST